MHIYVKNNKQTADVWCGMEIQPDAYYFIESIEKAKWANDSKVLADIGSGDLVVAKDDSGNTDIVDVSSAINFLKENILDIDTQGRQINRVAYAKAGWTYFAHPIEFETSTFDSLVSMKPDGTSRNDCIIKFYNTNNDEVTDPLQFLTITKTIVIIKPNYDYEMVSGSIRQYTDCLSDTRIWVQGGIPELGILKEFAGGINLRYIGANEELKTDGRASKYMAKTITGVPYQANQIVLTVRHPAGEQHKIMLLLEYYKE